MSYIQEEEKITWRKLDESIDLLALLLLQKSIPSGKYLGKLVVETAQPMVNIMMNMYLYANDTLVSSSTLKQVHSTTIPWFGRPYYLRYKEYRKIIFIL